MTRRTFDDQTRVRQNFVIIEGVKRGRTAREIGAQLGLTKTAVCKRRRAMHLPTANASGIITRRRFLASHGEAALAQLLAGDIAAICKLTKRSPSVIQKLRERAMRG